MKYIDLRKEYPHLDSTYSEYPVSYKIDAMFEQCRLTEQALEKRRRRNGDVISLDNEPGVEAHILEQVPGPEEEAMRHIQNAGRPDLCLLLYGHDLGRDRCCGRHLRTSGLLQHPDRQKESQKDFRKVFQRDLKNRLQMSLLIEGFSLLGEP